MGFDAKDAALVVKTFATRVDGSSQHHHQHLTEYLDGSSAATLVDPTHPLPVTVGNLPTILGTAVLSSVAASASSVTLLAANAARVGATVANDSSSVLYVKMGSGASSSSFTVKLFPDDYWETPFGYKGIIAGIWAVASGNARVTEFS